MPDSCEKVISLRGRFPTDSWGNIAELLRELPDESLSEETVDALFGQARFAVPIPLEESIKVGFVNPIEVVDQASTSGKLLAWRGRRVVGLEDENTPPPDPGKSA